MSAAATYNLYIEKGAGFDKPFVFREPLAEDGTPGALIDLSGYTAKMYVRSNVCADEILLQLTTENGRLVIDGTAGKIRIVLPASVTSTLDWSSAVYDLKLFPPTGEPDRFIEGQITVSSEVTHE